jgi:hypothetical protein
MNYRQILLAVAAIFIIAIFFHSSPYDMWYEDRIYKYGSQIYDEMDMMDYETRKEIKWGAAYLLFKSIKNKKDTNNYKDRLIVIPFGKHEKKFSKDFVMPEPITVYYFTGIRTVYHHRKDAYKARAVLLLDSSQYSITPVTDTSIITAAIKIYNKS